MNELERELALYRPAVALDRVVSRPARRVVSAFYDGAVILLGGIGLYELLTTGNTALFGLFFILLGIGMLALLRSWRANALYYRGMEPSGRSGIIYEAAAILDTPGGDLTRAFVLSEFGKGVLARLGVRDADTATFIASPRTTLSPSAIALPSARFLTPADVGAFVIGNDKTYESFLFSRGILMPAYEGTLAWMERLLAARKAKERWWSRDTMMKVKGLGADFSYGVAWELRRYLRALDRNGLFGVLSEDKEYEQAEVAKVETILARARGANPLLVGDSEVGVMEIALRLAEKIRDGSALRASEGKQIVAFDAEAFTATHDSKQELEPAFMKMFSEAERAGNLIVVFGNLPQFVANLEALGVDAPELMERFLSSPELHVIGMATTAGYHQYLESRPRFLERFSVVKVETPSLDTNVRALQDVAQIYERPGEVRFTYQALEAIAESADRYIVEGTMPDKAVDLLSEVVPAAGSEGMRAVSKEFVLEYIGKKTGIPTGVVHEEERDTLLNLEAKLHERVIGQEAAIAMIASAMRRARSGIEDKERPMGSFLFLGPTGVGKTETAKALAYVFFKDETRMLRLDMSEFSDPGALSRLLGEGTSPGVLPSMLRDHPYGVFLLDEFEKSSPDVRNLFLQILDEGVFSDARGMKVNARNSIIIATSNAGSQLIFEIAGKGGNLTARKEEVIDSVIHSGVYTPELLNRFDGVVLFEPLSNEHQKKIALLMLGDLGKRIEAKGYKLGFDDSILEFLVEKGYDAQFGARPLRRLIQDVLEEKVAEKIIAGGLKPGDTISFTREDVEAPAPQA